jgi:hypothetical protein
MGTIRKRAERMRVEAPTARKTRPGQYASNQGRPYSKMVSGRLTPPRRPRAAGFGANAERAHVLELVGTKQQQAARDKLRDELREVQIRLAGAQAEIANLRTLIATSGRDASTVELPAWPKRGEPKSVN